MKESIFNRKELGSDLCIEIESCPIDQTSKIILFSVNGA